MRKLKVAQIGLGHDHSSTVLNSLYSQSDIFDVAALAFPENELIQFKNKIEENSHSPIMAVEELLNLPDLDAVFIETEEKNLTKYALMAVEKGIAVHMDKPGGLDIKDYEKLITTAKKNNTVFHTGYMYRYNPAITDVFERVKNGEIGEIYSVEAHMDCLHPAQKREWLGEFPGGMMFFLGCHLIDLILRLQGMPEEIIPLNKCIGYDGVNNSDDLGMAVFKYKNGVSFAKTSALEAGGFTRRQLVICGTKGTFELRPLEMYGDATGINLYTDVNVVYTDEKDIWRAAGTKKRYGLFNRYDVMTKAFAEYVSGDKVNPYSYDYELELYKVLLKACGK